VRAIKQQASKPSTAPKPAYGSPAAAAARLGVVEVGALESGLRVDLQKPRASHQQLNLVGRARAQGAPSVSWSRKPHFRLAAAGGGGGGCKVVVVVVVVLLLLLLLLLLLVVWWWCWWWWWWCCCCWWWCCCCCWCKKQLFICPLGFVFLVCGGL
jgi:hypothetical protein